MQIRILSFLSLTVITHIVISAIQRPIVRKLPPESLTVFLRHADSESRLAIGHKLPLQLISREDLELIPGLTERSKSELYERRIQIRSRAALSGEAGLETALLGVHGIGPIKLKELSAYIHFK